MDIFSFDEFEDLPKKEGPEKKIQDEVIEEREQVDVPALYSDSAPTNALIKASMDVGINLSEQDMAELKSFMASSKYGHQSSLSMKCTGIKCDFYEICPLKKINAELPIGKQCPVENALIEQWVSMYFASLGLDKEDPGNSIEVHMVYELAGLELLRRRAANELSKDSSLVKNMIVGYSPQGEPIYDDKPAQALLILERHSKIVNKLRESLLATPKSAAQAGQINSDVSTRTANILKKTRAIVAARKSGNSIEDVNFQIIDQEDKENEDESKK